jgi:hypothetical protein
MESLTVPAMKLGAPLRASPPPPKRPRPEGSVATHGNGAVATHGNGAVATHENGAVAKYASVLPEVQMKIGAFRDEKKRWLQA